MPQQLKLTDVLELREWQKMQDHLSSTLGVAITIVNKEKEFLSPMSIPPNVARETLTSMLFAMTRCRECWSLCFPSNMENVEDNWQDGMRCSFGFHIFFVPMHIEDVTSSYLLVGPVVLGRRLNDMHYRESAAKLGIDGRAFLESMKESKAFTFYGIKSVIELLYDIVNYTLKLGCQNAHLKDAMAVSPKASKANESYYLEKMLNSLLDVSFTFTEAERASLMLFDESKGELYIKNARGISKDIVANTRLRLGEGIAGMVAQDRKPLFIDNSTNDNRLKALMKKPEIKSSISVPIRFDERLIGVLNVATSNPSSEKLSSKSVETVSSLVQLVEEAFKDFPRLFPQ